MKRARGLAEEGLDLARTQGYVPGEVQASLALARILLTSAGPGTQEEIEEVLARALEIARDTGGKVYEPLIRVELAELARQRSDGEGRERELREAHRLFTVIGASGHAEHLSAELATAS